MLAYRNVEAEELKPSSGSKAGLSSNDELSHFIREASSDLILLQSTETATYLATEIGKALFELTMQVDAQVNVQASLAEIGLDSLVVWS